MAQLSNAPSLTGILVYSATAEGGLAGYPGGQSVWNTDGVGPAANAWVMRDAMTNPFVNGPDNDQVAVCCPWWMA
jgi:hypothetical protein